MTTDIRRVVMISNRLPFVLERANGSWTVREGSGGLVTALAPVLRNRGGMWIGWPGAQGGDDIDAIVEEASRDAGYTMKGVHLTDEEVSGFYVGMSNEVIWPLFHDLQSMCHFEPAYWETYRAVNGKFADLIAEHTKRNDFIWVHDYHLFAVARELRARNVQSSLGFFLHIPFPPLDIFLKLPWRTELMRAVLDYDLIGLQTLRDRRNFINCVRSLVDGARVTGSGPVQEIHVGKRSIRVGVFPISIDFSAFEGIADSRTVADEAWYIHEHIPNGKIILGIDRLDYTKGIPLRLRAYDRFLADHPELHGQTTLVQVVVPSRRSIPRYRDLKIEIERLVGDINGRYTRSGWVPIHYIHRSLERTELFAYYRTAEILLVTPLKDGMNLVAKEYCAANIEGSGSLIISEFAGTAAQLQNGAILINPNHIEQVAEAIHQAYVMKADERKKRMRKMRSAVRRYDIFRWTNAFLETAIGRGLENFPPLDDYMPRVDVSRPDGG